MGGRGGGGATERSLKRLYILEVQRAEDVENKVGAVNRIRNTEV